MADGQTEAELRICRFLAEGGVGKIALARWTDSDDIGEDTENKAMRFPGVIPKEQSDHLLAELDSPVLCVMRKASLQKEAFFALKVVHISQKRNMSSISTIREEINILKLLTKDVGSPFVVKLLFSEETSAIVFIGMELCLGGDLFTLMSFARLNIPQILFFAAEIACGLDFLHQNHIIHGDLKPENVAMTRCGHVRLIDFGLSVQMDESRDFDKACGRLTVYRESGTLPYCSPEVLRRERHGFDSDWWSFGVVLFEMLFDDLPWIDASDEVTCSRICTEPLEPPSEDVVNDQCFYLIDQLLEKDLNVRLGMRNGLQEIKAHPFFHPLDFEMVLHEAYIPPLHTEVLESHNK